MEKGNNFHQGQLLCACRVHFNDVFRLSLDKMASWWVKPEAAMMLFWGVGRVPWLAMPSIGVEVLGVCTVHWLPTHLHFFINILVASIHLICHTEECTFSVSPRGWAGSHKVSFPRQQLLKVEAMKVDAEGNFVELSPRLDNFHDVPNKGKGPKKKTTSYKGPDKHGHYPSYRITLRESTNNESEQTGDSVDGAVKLPDVSLAKLAPFLDQGENREEFTIIIRKYNIRQSRRRVKTTVQKIDSYIKNRRHKLTVKENCPPSWQGILLLVLGIFGLLLTLLIGQFWEPEAHSNMRGPGTRSRTTPDYKGRRPQIQSTGRRFNKAY